MVKGKWRVVAPCVNQDCGDRLDTDDIVYELSEGELGRLLAFQNIEDISKKNDKKRNKTN